MSRFHAKGRVSCHGFSLVELLTATAVATLLMVILAGMSSQVSRLLVLSSSQAQHRNSARAALNFMGREMRQAVLSQDTTGSKASNLRFVINPTGMDVRYKNRDTAFWQAPVATTTTSGDLAEVGYFVAWQNKQPVLCRFFFNPTSANYRIYNDPTNWLDNTLIGYFAPGGLFQDQGFFLENVAGLWLTAYASSNLTTGVTTWDSKVSRSLPARVEISLLLLDSIAVKRLPDPINASNFATAEECLSELSRPQSQGSTVIREGSTIVNFSVVLDNAK